MQSSPVELPHSEPSQLPTFSLSPKLKKMITKMIKEKTLPAEFVNTVTEYYSPLCTQIAEARNTTKPMFIGLQGAQGTGKSTCADFLKDNLH